MASKLILIVDDNDQVRNVFCAVLNYDGYRVLEAMNGQEAVEKTLLHRPALILMDISMPVLDGFAATKIIRAEPESRDTVIIAVTGEDLTGPEYNGSATLFNNYFVKPLSPARILAEVQRMIGPPG
jgi:two-component system, cell cycle response regulator DivK